MNRFASRLLKWYKENRRALPWRDQADPYAVWVSEIMLQQTRVEAVIPYYLRWMERFPTLKALTKATEHEVLSMWEGLGYYARARNLRRAAQVVQERLAGELPRTAEELRKLPGIGRYTAGAIASIAFGCDEPALDGNIRRVLARVFDVREPADTVRGMNLLWKIAGEQLPKGRAGDYNQALMDLGATICVPGEPRCPICPLNALCESRKRGVQAKRPVMSAKKHVPRHMLAAAVVFRRGRVLLAQRPSPGLLAGMWEFPNVRVDHSGRRFAGRLRRAYGIAVKCGQSLGVLQHSYSHFHAEVHVFRCTPLIVPEAGTLRWVRVGELADFPMGRIDRQIARKLV